MNYSRQYVSIIICSIFLAPMLIISPTISDKVALVILPNNYPDQFPNDAPIGYFDYIALECSQILQFYGFDVISCNSTILPRIVAKQVIIIYAGHGHQTIPVVEIPNGELIPLKSILQKIIAKQLIILTQSCYGGNWLSFAKENRLIISATNHTRAYIQAFYINETYDLSPTLIDLLQLCKTRSLEDAYSTWRPSVIGYYLRGNLQASYPVMFDGIEGDTYLTHH